MTLLGLYRGITTVSAPLVRVMLSRRLRSGKEDPQRYAERFGIASRPRPPGALAWIHAASVGEALSVLALVERLAAERPALSVLVTTGTVTSAALMAERLPARAIHQYVPVDRTAWVRRFLDHWRPDLALWIESEFWPNLLGETHGRGIPAILLNARISQRSFAGWRRFPATIRDLLDRFVLCLPQSETDRERLAALDARRIGPAGNLKFAAAALPADPGALAALMDAIGDRPRWLAASTHPSEEEVILAAHRTLAARFPNLLTLIAPRHPARGPAIARMVHAGDGRIALRSSGATPDASDIYVADTVGELGLFYRLAPVSFVGGSLVAHGGQNILEPAKLGCAILHGPDMANFAAIAAEMREAGATETVADAPSLAAAVARLLEDESLRASRAGAAMEVARRKADVLDDVLREIAPWLDRLTPRIAAGETGPPLPRHARA